MLADERDVVRKRTNVLGEDVYLYPTTATPAEARDLLMSIIGRVNNIAAEPTFYNTLVDNCSTALVPHGEKTRRSRWLDPRLLLNGFSDKMAYDVGWIATDRSFAWAKAKHYINQYVADDPDIADFSLRIRPHLAGN